MIGQKWQSEITTFADEKTGRTIKQLTSTGNNVHMYFTENSFVRGKNEIIFQSDRASGEDKAPHEDPKYNIFRMNLDSGRNRADQRRRGAVAARRHQDAGRRPDRLHDRLRGQGAGHDQRRDNAALHRAGSYEMASVPSIAPNRQYVAFCRNEVSESPIHYHGANYSGFKERFYAIKDGRITLAYIDGSGCVRRVQGHASGRAFPVLAGRFDAGHVLPRGSLELGDAAHLVSGLHLARGAPLLPAGGAGLHRSRVLDAGRLRLLRRSRSRSRRHDHVGSDAGGRHRDQSQPERDDPVRRADGSEWQARPQDRPALLLQSLSRQPG